MSKVRKWEEDRDILIDAVKSGVYDPKILAQLCGRSEKSMRSRLQIMGLGFPNGNISQEIKKLVIDFARYLGISEEESLIKYSDFLEKRKYD